MPRLGPALLRRAKLALPAALLAATTLTTASSSTAAPAPSAAPTGCSMPDCYAAIAFNSQTGDWATANNYPTRRQASQKAKQLCQQAGARGKACELIGSIRGRNCLGTAMKYQNGEILAHRSAIRSAYRSALLTAKQKLPGPARFAYPITGVCNGG